MFGFGNKKKRPGDWNCKGCGFLMFSSKKYCFKCNLDKHGKPWNGNGGKKGDWKCKSCGYLVFASKNKCGKCNASRNGNVIDNDKKPNTNKDWKCKGCNFLVFGSKDKCIKCNMDKEGNPLDDDTKINDNNLCVICCMQPKNTIFLHKDSNDAHQICCYACAYKVNEQNGKCPYCNKDIKQIIKVYS